MPFQNVHIVNMYLQQEGHNNSTRLGCTVNIQTLEPKVKSTENYSTKWDGCGESEITRVNSMR